MADDTHDNPIDGDLLAAARLGELTAAQRDALNALLASSAAACRWYVEHMMLHADLRWERASVRLGAMGVASPSMSTAAPVRAERRIVRGVRWWIAVAGVAATIAVAGVVIGLMHGGEGGRAADRSPIAVVLEADGVAWSSEPVEAGDDVRPRDWAIDAGRLELQLRNGVSVVLTGPVVCRIDSPGRAELRRGTLSAQVPTGAVGFTVRTPGCRVVDLGTAFTVSVDASGESVVRVTEGAVRVDRGGDAGDAAVGLTLRRGDSAAAVDAGGRMWRIVERPIEVVNASFERVDAAADTGAADEPFVPYGRVPGWTASSGGAGSQSRRSEFAAVEADNFDDEAAEGGRVAQANAQSEADAAALVQDADAVFEAGVEYELTVGVGRRRDHDELGVGPASWAIGLHHAETGEAAGGGAAELRGQTIVGSGGTMSDRVVRFTATGDDNGRRIRVRLANTGGRSGFNAVNFDRVRLKRIERIEIHDADAPDGPVGGTPLQGASR